MLKPSEFTPLTALALAQIAAEIDFPEESIVGKLAIATGIREETFLDPIIIEAESSEALRFLARTGAGLSQD